MRCVIVPRQLGPPMLDTWTRLCLMPFVSWTTSRRKCIRPLGPVPTMLTTPRLELWSAVQSNEIGFVAGSAVAARAVWVSPTPVLATLSIASGPGLGTRIRVETPVAAAGADGA